MISLLQISGMLDYGKDCFRKICNRIRVGVGVMVTVQEGFLAVINTSMMVNDHWPTIILSAVYYLMGWENLLGYMFSSLFTQHTVVKGHLHNSASKTKVEPWWNLYQETQLKSMAYVAMLPFWKKSLKLFKIALLGPRTLFRQKLGWHKPYPKSCSDFFPFFFR